MSNIKRFKKQPVIIKAIQLTHENKKEIWDWLGSSYVSHSDCAETDHLSMNIATLEGLMRAEKGDWIIQGVEGEFYPCKDSIFKKTYGEVE